MFLTILELLVTILSCYVITFLLKNKLIEFRLKKQMPFIKGDSNSSIANFFLGNMNSLSGNGLFTKTFVKWQQDMGSGIFGFNLMCMPRVYIYDNELIQHIAMSKFTMEFVKPLDNKKAFKITKGLLLEEGEEHASDRKMMLPIFHISTVQQMFPIMLENAIKLCEIIRKSPTKNHDVMIDIQKCTLDIISKIAFDYDMGCLRGESKVAEAFDYLFVSGVFSIDFFLRILFPFYGWIPLPHIIHEEKQLKLVFNCVDDMISKRMKSGKMGKDLLSRCVDVAKTRKSTADIATSLRDHIVTFMVAGHGNFKFI
eukprot:NODE_785_length_3899_cov_1.070526.p2 type:complete len:312 gc:universal NODE_785_length_3899_cov_1.070526:3729-2794(-)